MARTIVSVAFNFVGGIISHIRYLNRLAINVVRLKGTKPVMYPSAMPSNSKCLWTTSTP